MASVFETLAEATGITAPDEGEGEQAFLSRVFLIANKFEDSVFDAFPEEVKLWLNEASEAVEFKKPIQMCPGQPSFANGAVDPEEPLPATPDVAEAEVSAEATAPAEKKTKATVTEAPATEAPAEKKRRGRPPKTEGTKKAKPPREEREPGVLHHLFEEVHADPTAPVSELQKRVEQKHGIEVKPANAIGIKQQYRRAVRFFHSKGLLLNIKL